MKRTIAIVVAVMAVVVISLGAWRRLQIRSATNSADYETVPVRRDTILAAVNAPGSVRPKEQVTLTFPSGGTLAELHVQPGQQVKAGEALARLDIRQLELNVVQADATLKINEARLAQTKAGTQPADLASAEASVASAEALYNAAKNKLGLQSEQLSIAEADLKKAELTLLDAQAAYDRVASRPDIGMLPQALALERATIDYQRALANYKLQVAAVDDTSFKSAAAQLAQAQAQLEKLRQAPLAEELAIAEAQVEQARASLEQAKLRLADAALVAPFSGTVVSTGAKVGELVSAATPMIVLADLEHYYIDVTIDETDIGHIQIGQDAVITLDAFPEVTLQGKVTSLDPVGKSTQGVVSFGAEIRVLATDVPLRPGMTATADITVARKEGVLVVPNRAIRRDSGGRYYVEILSAGEVKQRLVTTGASNELVTEIVNGLSEEEEVVVSAPRSNIVEELGRSPFRLGGGR